MVGIRKPRRPKRKGLKRTSDADIALVQAIARELAGQRVLGSLTSLSRYSQISLDSLRQLKRSREAAGARLISPTRLRLLALLIAIYRRGLFEQLMGEAETLEREWRGKYPDLIR